MARLKNLAMADVIARHKHINIRKSFFGLIETVIYNQTGSEVEIKQIEYSSESGKEIEKLLQAPKLKDALASIGKIKQRPMSNVRLDICVSKDHQFIALQLFNYYDLMFHPVTETKILEGQDADLMAKAVL